MKTEQEVIEMKDAVQKKIDDCYKMALAQPDYNDAKKWLELRLQFIAQHNILLEVLK